MKSPNNFEGRAIRGIGHFGTDAEEPPGNEIGYDPKNLAHSNSSRKTILTGPVIVVRKAKKDEAIRINPKMSCVVYLFEQSVEFKPMFILVTQSYVHFFKTEKPKQRELFLACNSRNEYFFHPVAMEYSRRPTDPWTRSMREKCIPVLSKTWGHLVPENNRKFVVYGAFKEFADPVWPDGNIKKLVAQAFGTQIVNSADHYLVQREMKRKKLT